MKVDNIKLQVDPFVLPVRHGVLASERFLNVGLPFWSSVLLDVVSFKKQVLAQIC